MKFRTIGVGRRLWIGFSTVLALFIATSIFSMHEMQALASTTAEIIHAPVLKERMAEEWYRSIYAGTRRTSAIAKSSDTTLEAFFAKDAKQAAVRGDQLRDQLAKLIESERERALFIDVGDKRKSYVDAREKIYAIKRSGNLAAAETELQGRFLPASDAYLQAVSGFLDYQKSQIDEMGRAIQAEHEKTRRVVSALVVTAALLSLGFALAITMSIVAPIRLALETVTQVAAGDLSRAPTAQQVPHEIGLLLHRVEEMRRSLGQRIFNVAVGTRTISTASNEIAKGNLDLSARTESQAASLEETASAMESINDAFKDTVTSAKQATRIAAAANEVAGRVGSDFEEITSTMSRIDASSKKISEIISVIDGIAFQTNILSLNASVEAARAGEHGRGFAVVATEVRNLAQRAAGAAKEIKTLIHVSAEQVRDGGALVLSARSTMDELFASVRSVTGIITDIAGSSSEQGRSIEQINMAIQSLDAITQQNAALVEEAAAAAQSMGEQSQEVMQMVAEFKLPMEEQGVISKPVACTTFIS
jgi:methyl-accepting chemotaxis protein